MRILRRVLLVLLLVVIVAAVGGYWYERPLLRTGTGYAAHNACAVTEISHRANPQDDLPPNPLVPLLSTDVDPTGHSASTSIKGLLARQTAWYTPGFGCTIADERPDLGTATTVQASSNPLAAQTVAADPAIDALIADAFGDSLAAAERKDLGTRAVLVVKDGTIIGERYADGFTKDTPQLGWSMSKSVTSLLTGRLVAQGKVAVTDDHLRPEWTDDRASITVDDLLRMTSGLAWDETYDLGTPITQMLYGEKDMAGYVAAQASAHEPATYQQYSSGSTTLLCSVLGAKAAVTTDLPRQQIFAPLGLSSAVLEPDAVGTPVCSSYMWATPRDWAAVGQFALDDGVWGGKRLLPEGWMAQTTTVKAVDSTEETGYAAGWWVNKLPDGTLADPTLPADAYWANGHDGQRIFVVPSAKLVVVRLGFSPSVDPADLRITALVAAAAKT